jgi:PASTA domain
VNTVKPLVTGEPQVGLKLSVDTGTWAAKPPVEYSFQWQSCDAALTSCANITGATDVDYFPLAFDVGSKLRAVVTATNPGGKTSATSEPTDLVRGRPVPRRCVVPRLKRKTLSQARAALRRRHCRLGVVRHAHSARVRRGRVIAQRPAAGNRLREGARVNVTLSSGPRK